MFYGSSWCFEVCFLAFTENILFKSYGVITTAFASLLPNELSVDKKNGFFFNMRVKYIQQLLLEHPTTDSLLIAENYVTNECLGFFESI